LSHTWLNW